MNNGEGMEIEEDRPKRGRGRPPVNPNKWYLLFASYFEVIVSKFIAIIYRFNK